MPSFLVAGMQAIERLIVSGKQRNELFTARTLEIPDPSRSGNPATTPPSPTARRLMETLNAKPPIWLAAVPEGAVA